MHYVHVCMCALVYLFCSRSSMLLISTAHVCHIARNCFILVATTINLLRCKIHLIKNSAFSNNWIANNTQRIGLFVSMQMRCEFRRFQMFNRLFFYNEMKILFYVAIDAQK